MKSYSYIRILGLTGGFVLLSTSNSSAAALDVALLVSGFLFNVLIVGFVVWIFFAGGKKKIKSLFQNKANDPAEKKPEIVSVDHGFFSQVSEDGKSTFISIQGSGIGIGAWIAIIFGGFIFACLLTLVFTLMFEWKGPASAIFFGLAIVASIAIPFLWNKHRRRYFSFHIDEAGIKLPDGHVYAKSDISQILIRNQTGQVTRSASTQSTTVVAGTGFVGAAAVGAVALNNASSKMGEAIGEAIVDSVSKRNNEVCIRHGRNVIPLAMFLQEDDAISLFNKVEELL